MRVVQKPSLTPSLKKNLAGLLSEAEVIHRNQRRCELDHIHPRSADLDFLASPTCSSITEALCLMALETKRYRTSDPMVPFRQQHMILFPHDKRELCVKLFQIS